MKKFIKLTSLLILFISVIKTPSCSASTKLSIDELTDIYYQTEEGEYMLVNDEEIKNFIINQLDIDNENTTIDSLRIEESENGTVIKANVESEEVSYSFGILLTPIDGSSNGGTSGYRMGKTCSCAGCPDGCRLTVNGLNCNCSRCSRITNIDPKCTKTETQTVGAFYSAGDFE